MRSLPAFRARFAGTPLKLYPGVSFRQLLVWKGGREEIRTIPPHDILGQPIAQYGVLSTEPVLQAFTEKAARVLKDHPVNSAREEAGKSPANAVWLWGQGKAPSMPGLERFGLHGAMISAVDLLKGIGVYAGLDPVKVEGATGYIDTNYDGKVAAALSALERGNFVFLHVEAPDEASHTGSLENENPSHREFRRDVLSDQLLTGRKNFVKYAFWLQPTILPLLPYGTHSMDPVPFLLVDDLKSEGSGIGQGRQVLRETGSRAGLAARVR